MGRIEFIDLKAQYDALKGEINQRIQTVLDHGQFIMGPEVAQMEERLADFIESRHCISVSSGTEALLISLMALGIQPGDEVITTPFTFIATVETIRHLGAMPVYADIDPLTCTLDPSQLAALFTPRTRAIMPVSLYGQTANMDEINALAEAHGVAVIEDGAQSFGARYRSGHSCNLSTIGCTSFFPSKPLGCYGDGGAIFTNDDRLAQVMREIRVHGQSARYVHNRIGVGGRMDTLQCAIILAKLTRFPWEVERRAQLGERYNQLLAHTPGLALVPVGENRTSVFAQYTIRVNNRPAFLEAMHKKGVPTSVHYPTPIYHQGAYLETAPPSPLPQVESAASQVVSLPIHPFMDEETQNIIVQAVREAIRETDPHPPAVGI